MLFRSLDSRQAGKSMAKLHEAGSKIANQRQIMAFIAFQAMVANLSIIQKGCISVSFAKTEKVVVCFDVSGKT